MRCPEGEHVLIEKGDGNVDSFLAFVQLASAKAEITNSTAATGYSVYATFWMFSLEEASGFQETNICLRDFSECTALTSSWK